MEDQHPGSRIQNPGSRIQDPGLCLKEGNLLSLVDDASPLPHSGLPTSTPDDSKQYHNMMIENLSPAQVEIKATLFVTVMYLTLEAINYYYYLSPGTRTGSSGSSGGRPRHISRRD